MKKLYLYIVVITSMLVTINTKLQGQMYFQLGYNAGFPLNFSNLNYVVDRYNETRSYLQTQMKHFNYLDGFTFTFGAVFQPVFIEMGYSGGNQVRFAEGVDYTGILKRREVKVRNTMFEFGGGFAITDDGNGLFLGTNMHLGAFTVKTRVAAAAEIKDANWSDNINPWDDMLFAQSFYLRLVMNRISIQPYLLLGWGKMFRYDMTDVNEALNPLSYAADPSPLEISQATVGIKLCLGLVGKD